jgi:hypothetical protein
MTKPTLTAPKKAKLKAWADRLPVNHPNKEAIAALAK